MLIEVNPIRLDGPWDVGYALDLHTLHSDYLGEDPYDGHPLFNTTYTEIGKLLHQFKYREGMGNLSPIVETVVDFLKKQRDMQGFETIIPVPPTPGKYRVYQPTMEIARAVAEAAHMYCCEDVLEKVSDQQLKGMSSEDKQKIDNLIILKKNARRENSVLLIDDLYQTGTTLTHCVRALREDPMVRKIGVLTITITRTKN